MSEIKDTNIADEAEAAPSGGGGGAEVIELSSDVSDFDSGSSSSGPGDVNWAKIKAEIEAEENE